MIKNISRRFLSFSLAVLMAAALIPAVPMTVHAAISSELTGLSNSDIGVSYTSPKDNGTYTSWSASGNSIFGSAKDEAGTCGNTNYETTLTITNKKDVSAVLSFDYTIVQNNGTIQVAGTKVTENGSYSRELKTGDTINVYLKSGDTNATTISITNLSLLVDVEATTTFLPAENGSYTVNDEKITGEMSTTQSSTVSYTMRATPDVGYKFMGWYSVTGEKYLSSDVSAKLNFDSDQTITAMFTEKDNPVFEVGASKFTDLNEANKYAVEHSQSKITLVSDGTLPGGNYAVSKGIILLIPFDEQGTCYTTAPANTGNVRTAPSVYRTLTMAEGASITVDGAISVSAKHYAYGQAGGGAPDGKYGYIYMKNSSSITVNDGGAMYVYGFVSGKGTVTARSGATVYENMQICDFRGGSASAGLSSAASGKAFLFNQYFIQNIETKLTLESGANEYIYTSLYARNMATSTAVHFIGNGGMFAVAEGGSFTKEYLPDKDRLEVTVKGDASVNNLTLTVMGMSVSSQDYVLPINNAITLKILSGTTKITQDIALLPGVQVEIAQGATLEVTENSNVYVYDRDEWMGKGFASADGANFKATPYSPTRTYNRKETDLVDAKVDVNGTLTANGYIYTTVSGADICSSEGTGRVELNNGAGDKTKAYQVSKDSTNLTEIDITSAKLHNGLQYVGNEEEYTATQKAEAGTIYNYDKEQEKWVGPCEHDYQQSSTVDATCTEEGSTTYTCSLCGDSYIESIPALGHAYESVVTDPTCTEQGYTTHTCTRCEESYVDEYTSARHDWNDGETEKEATCTEEGVLILTCNRCEATEKRAISATGHTAVVDPSIDPTCTESGKTEGSHCSVCGAVIVEQEMITALGHAYEGEVTEPTCKEQGYTTYTCTRCDDSYVTDYVNIVEHSYDSGVVTTPATCTGEGEITYTCIFCGDTKTEKIPAAGHTEVIDEAVPATCTETGLTEGKHCSVCGEILAAQQTVEALGHDYGSTTVAPTDTVQGVTTYTCSRCQDAYTEYLIGLCDINGDTYYLNESSYAVSGLVKVVKDEGEVNYYYFGDDFKAYKATADTNHYTVEKNNGLALPEGINYVFGENGVIAHFDDTSINGIYLDESSSDYYYCVDGVIIANGLMKIGDDYYYAKTSSGAFVRGGNYWITRTNDLLEEGIYTFDDDGKIVFPEENERKDGIVEENGSLYYYVDGVLTGAGLIQIDEDYYYVRTSNGEVIHGRSYWITETNDLLSAGVYTFDGDGKIIIPEEGEKKNGIVEENGSLYYYVDDILTGAGLIQIDGNYYYVRTSNGEVVHGRSYWITVTNGLPVSSGVYTFAEDGKMISE